MDCVEAEAACKSDSVCHIPLAAFKFNCMATPLKLVTCRLCKISSGALRILNKGKAYATCDCRNDTDCKLTRHKVDECLNR